MIQNARKYKPDVPIYNAKTIGEVDHDRPFFPGDASLKKIMPDMEQTKDKEYLSMSNVSYRPKRKCNANSCQCRYSRIFASK